MSDGALMQEPTLMIFVSTVRICAPHHVDGGLEGRSMQDANVRVGVSLTA
jgi:hypothetical protein